MQDLIDAVGHHNAGRVDQAQALYIKVLGRRPDSSDAWHLLGMIHLRAGDPERARRYLHRALALSAGQAAAYNNLANVYGALSDRPAATACYDRALRLDPLSPLGIHLGAAALEGFQGNHQRALAILRRCAVVHPGEERTWTLLCYTAYQLGRYPDMADYARLSVRMAPGTAAPLLQVGKYFIENGQLAAAHLYLAQVLRDHPELAHLHGPMAQVEALLGRNRQALARRWRTTNLNFVALPQELLPEATADEVLDGVDATLPPELREQDCLIYPFIRFNLLGHLAFEPQVVKRMYGGDHKNIVVVTPPLEKYPRANKALLDIVMKDAHWVQTGDIRVTSLSSSDIGEFRRRNRMYLFHTIRHVETEFYFYCMNGGGRGDAFLPDYLCESGRRQEQALGIPEDAPVVVVHMRESGYHLNCADLFSFRDVSPADYIDAFRYLTKRGYYVIRIGDRSMSPLPDLGPQVIDAPFDPRYEAYSDIYFISKCSFMISSLSGPDDVARMFKRPVLALNVPLTYNSISTADYEMFVFKRYFDPSRPGRHYLNLRRLLELQVPYMSTSSDMDTGGVAIENLSAAEITASVQEMETLLARRTPHTDSTPRFRAACIAEDDLRRNDPTKIHNYRNWFGHARSTALIPDGYCERTGFLED